MKNPFAASFEPLAVALPLAGLFVLAALVVAAWRLWRGPTEADRVISLDLLTGVGLALVVLLAITADQAVYLDVAVAIAVIGFVGTAALARRIQKGGKS
jgi:multicomponent Na+:H+ antiporter subunit F